MDRLTGEYAKRAFDTNLQSAIISIQPMASLPHGNYLYSAAMTSDPFRIIATGDGYGTIFIWDAFDTMNGEQLLSRIQRQGLVDTVTKQGVLLSSFPLYEKPGAQNILSPVHSLDIHNEGVWCLSGTAQGHIHLYGVRKDTGKCFATFTSGDQVPISDIRITPCQKKAVTGSWAGQLQIWDLEKAKVLGAFTSAKGIQVTSIQHQPLTLASKHPSVFLSTTLDGTISIFDVRVNKQVKTLIPSRDTPPWALDATFSHDGQNILVGRRDSKVEEYCRGEYHRAYKLPPGSGPVSHAQYLPNNHAICSSIDNIRLLNMPQYDQIMNEMPSDDAYFVTPSIIQSSHHGGPVSRMLLDNQCEFLLTGLGTRDFPLDAYSGGVATTFQVNPKVKKAQESMSSGSVNAFLYELRPRT